MRDILEGGDYQAKPALPSPRAARLTAHLHRGRGYRRILARRRPTPPNITVQPGQLASPQLKSGFPSLLQH